MTTGTSIAFFYFPIYRPSIKPRLNASTKDFFLAGLPSERPVRLAGRASSHLHFCIPVFHLHISKLAHYHIITRLYSPA
jgi:hypothetical protein